jgi:phosphoribosylformimino-5-aminoimidazole carboxamide ribonucleotide (ProFAR) isomerase
MLTGPNLSALEDLLPKSPFPVIASGGIATPGDVRALARLQTKGLCGAIIGKALYAGNLDYHEACQAALSPP